MRFAFGVTATFVVLTLPRMLLHELWRDEAWQWLVVIESHGLRDLFAGLAGGSGVGYLFPLICYLAAQVSSSPRVYQLVHLAVASGAVFVFARWAPFGRRERVLFVFGYFLSYEYAVISRSYAMGVLLLWLTCAAVVGRWRPVAVGAMLALLVQTTAYSFLLGIAIASAWLIECWLQRRATNPAPWTDAATVGALTLAGLCAAVFQIVPASSSAAAVPAWRFGWDLTDVLKTVSTTWRAFVPLPQLQLNFWNTNVLQPWPPLRALGGFLALFVGLAVVWRRRLPLAVFGLGAAALLAFGYVLYPGSIRHHGHLWLLFVAALWLGGGQAMLGDRRSWRSRVLLVLLIVQVAAAAFASWMDLRHPFSNGKATAAFIRNTGLDRYPLLGHREMPATPVALFLGRPLYSPSRKIFVSHPDWGPDQRELTRHELRCAARELAGREGRDIVLVMNYQLSPWEELDAAGSVVGAIEAGEDYHLYLLRHARLEATASAAACSR
jgi:hypothetical protein